MSVSSFNDKMTLGVGLYGTKNDRETIEDFFSLVDKALELL